MGYAIPTFPTTFTGTGGSGGGGACTVNNYITCGSGSGGGDGSGPAGFANWVRYNHAGTKLAGTGITPLRTAVGTVKLTADAAFLESGGFSQYGVLGTVSAALAGGGEGVSAYKKFDSHNPQPTGQSGSQNFFRSPLTNKIYVLCDADAKIWIHDLANWTAGPTTITPGSPIRTAENSGCMTPAGDKIYLSGDTAAGGYPIRVFNTVTGITVPLTPTIDGICIGADDNGNLLVYTGGQINQYTPNIGSGTLGVVVATWAVPAQSYAALDHDGNFWVHYTDSIYCLRPGGANTRYLYPVPPTGLGRTGMIQADHNNRCLYLPLGDVAAKGYIYRFSGWSVNSPNSGFWKVIITPLINGQYLGIEYDEDSGILFCVDPIAGQNIQRWLPNTETILDTVSVFDTAIANPEIDYNLTSSRNAVYNADYGYIMVQKGTVFLDRVSYKGPALAGGGGGGFISNIINWAYEIISASESYLYTFRQGAPNQLVDAEVTACFTSDASSVVIPPGGTVGEDLHQHVMSFAFGDSTPALIGTLVGGKQVLSTQIFITTAFNGAGATLSVGPSAFPTDLMTTAENNPAVMGEYDVYTQKMYGANTQVFLHIVPGSGASAGTGVVVIEYEP